jgi:AraC family ethanolamine operon transcriptional activator
MFRDARPQAPAAAEPTRSFALRLTSFDDLARAFARWEGRFEQLSAGRFEGTVAVAQGRHLRVFLVETNQTALARGRDGPGRCLVSLVSPRNARAVWQGRHLGPGQLNVLGADVGADHRSAKHYENLTVSVREDDLRAAVRALGGPDLSPTPLGWAAVVPPPRAYAALDGRLRRFVRAATADPAWAATPDGVLQEQACLRAVVAAVIPTADGRRTAVNGVSRAALVRRADELMRANLRAPLGTIDLCTALGVSDRTLRLAFRERFGLGPVAYGKALRLNAVRAALTTTDAGVVSVGGVARLWGFGHLGNFAADYRWLFGELPSQTLHRGRAPARSSR